MAGLWEIVAPDHVRPALSVWAFLVVVHAHGSSKAAPDAPSFVAVVREAVGARAC